MGRRGGPRQLQASHQSDLPHIGLGHGGKTCAVGSEPLESLDLALFLEDHLLGRVPLEMDVDLGGGADHFVGHLAEEDLPDYVSSDEEDRDLEEGEIFVFEEEDPSDDSVDSGYNSKTEDEDDLEDNEDDEDDEDNEDNEGLNLRFVHQVPPGDAPAPVPAAAPQQPMVWLAERPQLLWLPEQHKEEPEEALDRASHRLGGWIRRIREESSAAQFLPNKGRAVKDGALQKQLFSPGFRRINTASAPTPWKKRLTRRGGWMATGQTRGGWSPVFHSV
ncbi:hypothetical protein INR49_003564, partial [Caranx melampygus]